MLLLAGFVVGSVRPMDVAAVSARYPGIEDRSTRAPSGEGCGLTERATGGGCAPWPGSGYREIEVSFPSRLRDKGLPELRGTLVVPQGLEPGERRPAAILVHGSGPNLRDGVMPGDLLVAFDEPFFLYRDLTRHLATKGIVTLRWDKRSSPAYADDWTFDARSFRFTDFADDARDALDFLAGRSEVDPDALISMGHSQGGQLAPFVAEGDGRVVAVVMLAGTTQPFDALLVEQIERQLDARRAQLDLAAPLNFWLLPKPWEACFATVRAGGFEPDAPCMAGASNQAFAEYFALADRTADVLRALDCPVFAIQGSADINIDPEEIPRLRGILAGHDAELHRVPGMGHGLTDSVSPASPPTIHPELLSRLERFLTSVRRPRGEVLAAPP